MTTRPQSVDEVFEAALDREPADRAAYLNTCCPGDPALRQEVEDLIASHESAPDDFLERPAVELIAGGHLISGSVNPGPHEPLDLTPAPPRFAPGHIIAGRFVIIRFIARGGMGEVYEADDLLLGGDEHVALKTILPHIAQDAALAGRFEQEVRLARKLVHRNLCPIYDLARCTDAEPAFVFLTMQLLSGETLADRLRALEPPASEPPASGPPVSGRDARPAERIPLGEAACIFRQLLAGIAAIHAANVIHGDIKPNNVMLDGTGDAVRVHIMDFGLARLHETGATQVTRSLVAGTLGYLAPEILRGGRPSPASDLFALGVLLHKVLTGDIPDPADATPAEPLPKLVASDAPPALIHFIRELLADDTARREAACAEMKHYFNVDDGAPSDPDLQRPLWTPPRPTHPVFTRRRVLVGAGAAAACIATGAAAWNRDTLDDLLHPLPRKRFVSLIGWPPTKDPHLKPMLMGLIELIGNELARAEAYDHDLYVVPHLSPTDITGSAQIDAIREADGANLVLAASAAPTSNNMRVSFQVLDPAQMHPLRSREVRQPLGQQTALSSQAVRTAADLLDIRHFTPDVKRLSGGTDNPQALRAFQEAELLYKQPNDGGIGAATEKYKEAVELDTKYALAFAKLALAQARVYYVRRDQGDLLLAQENANSAIAADPKLLEGHLARAAVLDLSGDHSGALHETSQAIAMNPGHARASIYHAQMLIKANSWQEAEQYFRDAIRARPNDWLAHHELGVLYQLRAKYRDSIKQFQMATSTSPRRTLGWSNLAFSCLQLGERAEAESYAMRSMSIEPNGDAANVLAALNRSRRNYDVAADAARKAVELDPAYPRNWIELGDCYSAMHAQADPAKKAYQKAAETQDQLLAVDPQDGPGIIVLALARAKARVTDDVMNLVAQAERLFVADMDSQLFKLRILELSHRRAEAIATLKQCLRQGATFFQIQSLPDCDGLRTESEIQTLLSQLKASS